MMQQSNAVLCRRFFLLSASVIALLVASVLPSHACGRGGHEGPLGFGPGFFAHLEPDLALTDAQHTRLAEITERAKQLRASASGQRRSFHDAYKEELANSEPNLQKLFKSFESQMDGRRSTVRDLLEAQIDFYEELSSEQKKLVTEKLRDRHMKLEEMREHHKGHDQEHRGESCEYDFEGDQ